MDDQQASKVQLLNALEQARRRVAELERTIDRLGGEPPKAEQITPPISSGDGTQVRRARALKQMLSLAVIISFGFVFAPWLNGEREVRVYVILAGLFGVNLSLYLGMRRGSTTLLGGLFLAANFLAMTALIVATDGLNTQLTTFYFTLLLTAGFLFDMPGVIAMAAIEVPTLAGLSMADQAGWLPQYAGTLPVGALYVTLLVETILLTYWTFQSLRQSLAQANLEIAERKQLEKAWRESEGRFQILFDKHDSIMLLIEPGTGDIVDANQAAQKFYGYSHGQLQGMKIEQINLLPPEEVRKQRERAARESLNYFVFPHRLASGEIRQVEVHSSPITVNGTVLLFSIIHDVTERKQMEEALHRANERFRQVMTQVNELVWFSALDNSETSEVNPAFEELYGLSASEFKANPGIWLQAVHPDDIELAKSSSAALFKDGYAEVEYRILHGDGSVRWIRDRKSILYDGQGQPSQMGGTAIDITQRRQAENALRESEERFRGLTEFSPTAIVAFNEDRKVELINRKAVELFGGQSADDFLGQPVQERVHPEQRARAMGQIAQADAVDSSGPQIETVFLRLDGSSFEVILSGIPLKFQGKRWYVVSFLDITERKQMEQTLRQSEMELKRSQAAGHLGHWAWDILANRVAYSDELFRLYGLAPATFTGDPFQAVNTCVHPDDRAGMVEIGAAVMRGEKPAPTEYRVVWPDGSIRTLYTEISESTFDEQGRLVGVWGIVQDITDRKQAELALRESEAKFAAAFHTSPFGLGIVGTDRRHIEANRALCDLLGYTRDEIIGKTAQELAILDETREEKIHDTLLASGGRIDNAEIEMRSRDGRIHQVLYSVSPFEINGVTQFVGMALDITRRKQTEEKLRESEKTAQVILNAVTESLFLMDINGQVLAANVTAASRLGQQVSDLVGANIYDFIPAENALARKIRAAKVVQEQQGVHFEDLRRGRWLDNYIYPIVDEDGQVRRLTIYGQDITERKQAERDLRASEEKYRGLMESLDNMVALLDREGRYLYLNDVAASQFGSTPAELIGKTMLDLFPEPVALRQLKKLRRVFDEDQALIVEEQSISRGKPHWLRVSLQPIHDEQGAVSAVLVNATDIHELKTTQQALQELNQSLEAKVKERSAQWQDLYDNAPVGYHSLDANGNFITVNQTELDWLGYTREELLGKPAALIFSSQHLGIFNEHFPQLRANGILKDLEFEVVRKDGSTFPALVNATAIYDAAGNFLSSRSTLADITARKQAEEKLRQSEEKYAALFHKSAVPAILSKYPENIYADVNEAFVSLYGYSRQEMLGKTSLDIGLIRPGTRARLFETFKNRGVFTGNEVPVFTKQGEERIVIVNTNTVELDGQAFLITTAYDVTDQRRAEAALHASEERMDLAFQAAQDGIWDWNVETDEVFYSPRWKSMLGYEAGEIEHHVSAWKRLLHPDDLEKSLQVVADVLHNKREYMLEFRMWHKDGHYVDILSRGIPLRREPAGPIVRIVGTHLDLTERKRAEEALRLTNAELERAVRIKDEFLATMSHELRTPLNAVLGLTTGLLEQRIGPLNERQSDALHIVETSGQHLLALINDILDLSKLEARQSMLDLTSVNADEVCATSLLFVKQQAFKKRIVLTHTVDPAVGRIRADERRLKQMLINLLTNAVKFTPEGGTIGLEVHGNVPGQTVSFTVSDTGIGIAPDDLSRLFQPFVQLDSALNRRYEGTGLGLALVARLASLHGGRVTVHSIVGAGSRFTIELPWQTDAAAVPLAAADSSQAADLLAQPLADAPLILIAEDNEANLRMLSLYLEAIGYRLAVARNGREALDYARRQPPALILMDLQMPLMDGLEATRRLRREADPRVAGIPVIALTALVMPDDRSRALQAGANDYVSKPVDLKYLVKLIERLIKEQ